MRRREFLATSVAGIAGAGSLAVAKEKTEREYFELRCYHTRARPKNRLVGDFLKDVAIAAMNRIGIKPVGVFNVKYGPNKPSLYVLAVHKSLASVVNASARLLQDDEYRKSDFVNAAMSDPMYVRYESSLMVAFKDMPKLAVPERKARIFELRTYESHSIKAAKKKIEMFNEGGEIAIFKKTGLQPVFFGETIIGPKLPNLTYMLAFDNMEHRDKSWAVFGRDPDWRKLRANPAYKDTVSNVTDLILQPTSYSQI
ncbi:MAG: NIPSNAP family protein [Sedimentisphaerales bacterium]